MTRYGHIPHTVRHEHEQRHSAQWAAWGSTYPLAYGLAAAYSEKESGDYWTANYFENDAGLTEGGY